MPDPKAVRKSQRQPLSCTNCAQRKLRCSKSIPCLSCIDRHQEDSCHRERIHLLPSKRKSASRARPSDTNDRRSQQIQSHASTPNAEPGIEVQPAADNSSSSPSNTVQKAVSNGTLDADSSSGLTIQPPRIDSRFSQTRVQPRRIRDETVVTLEFLTHGRQNILSIANSSFDDAIASSVASESQTGQVLRAEDPPWHEYISAEHAALLLAFHQEDLAWMHNVLHMPTFRQEFENRLFENQWDNSWLALFYALICTTVYHADEALLQDLGLSTSVAYVQTLYNQSIKSLQEANYMSIHRLANVQTICVLLQVAHNLDQSDFISVLLATGIKISQSLGLHRLGSERTDIGRNTNTNFLVDREVKKRVWWFMIRQDWLQIPFQNTYLIHASQFNTPMPLNCFDELDRMIHENHIMVQEDSVFTPTSYSNVMNQVSVIIWKHQDRMCNVGYPGDSRERILKLYAETLWADGELKQKFMEMPAFLRDGDKISFSAYPDYVKQLRSIRLLCMAHKTLTVHRHFQLQSFRDKAFAFTQQSCLAISQKSIREIAKWPSNPASRMALKMWTVITHLVTCCVNLTFASIFRGENILMYEGAEMQRLAKVGRDVIRKVEEWSSIARRGGKLLDVLFELDQSLRESPDAHFSIEEIVSKVSEIDNTVYCGLPEGFDALFDLNTVNEIAGQIFI